MGIQHQGAFGGFQGKAGPLVGHRVNGQNVITGIPYPSTEPPTELQLNARIRFKLLVGFLRPINSLLRVGFKNVKKEKQSGFNAAFSANYSAVTGVAPNYVISYAQVMVSKGSLAPAYAPEVSTVVGAGIKFDWSALAVLDSGEPTDLVTVLVYNEAQNLFVGFMGVAARSALTYTLDLPSEFAGDQVQCWISMASANGDLVSDSKFVGSLTVVA